MALTPSQQQAVYSDRHSVLIANAGSGKTYTLVRKYIHLLESFTDLSVSQIIAITFTENAAAELQEKIAKGIRERIDELQDSGTHPEAISTLYKALYEIDSAPISTIHTFCSHLLRNHPIEAKIDPAFVVIEGIERKLLIDECIDTTFHTVLTSIYNNEENYLPLRTAFMLYGRQRLKDTLATMLDKRFTAEAATNFFSARTDTEILKELHEEYISTVIQVLASEDTAEGLSRLRSLIIAGKKGEAAHEAYNNYLAAKNPEQKITAFYELCEQWLTKALTPLATVFGRKETVSAQEAASITSVLLEEALCYVPAIADAQAFTQLNEVTFSGLRAVLELYRLVLSAFNEQKQQFGFLDHDELIERAMILLEEPEVAREIAAEYRFCFIDEYQDTDERQYRILKALTQAFTNHIQSVIVGDPKQSIYRFREANLEVFQQTVEECLAITGDEKPIELRESFRMLEAPLGVINQITDRLFGVRSDHAYYYKPLVLGRIEKIPGDVRLVLSDATNPDNPADSEETVIAKTIHHLTAGSALFKDIAILLRKRTQLASLELELRAHKIPYTVNGGLGFYQQQEIIDLITLLQFLLDPGDTLSFVGLLRSPYIALDDKTIWQYHRLWKKQVSLTFYEFLLSTPLASALQLLEEWLILAGRTSVRELLRKIVDKSAIELVYYTFADGIQKVSNVRKLIDIAAQRDLPLREFVDQCLLYQERGEREQQAPAEVTENAVRIMTVHASKGLQFPIVILPYLAEGKGRSFGRTGISLSRRRPYFPIEVLTDEGQAIKHPITTLSAIEEKLEEIEEEKRIFYVAMTRAENSLIFSATLDSDKIPSNTPLAWLTSSLSVTASELVAVSEITLQRIIQLYDPELNTKEYIDKSIDLQIPIIKKLEDSHQAELFDTIEKSPITEIDLSEYPPQQGITRYSPTQLLTWTECPTKYYLRYKLGIPEEELPKTVQDESDDPFEISGGSTYGRLFHTVLEHIGELIENTAVDETLLAPLIERTLGITSSFTTRERETFERLQREILLFNSHPLLQHILSATASFAELPIRLNLTEHLVLSGIIDRLFQDSDGVWNVVDYKTTQRPTPEDIARYDFQMKVYAYLIFKLYTIETVRTHLYFSTTAEQRTHVYSIVECDKIEAEILQIIRNIITDTHTDSLKSVVKNRHHCPECAFSVDKNVTCILDPQLIPTDIPTR